MSAGFHRGHGEGQLMPPLSRALMALHRQYEVPQWWDGRPSFWERPSRELPDPKGIRHGGSAISSSGR